MKRAIMMMGVLGLVAAAQAQYSSNFEPRTYAGAPGGVSVVGQDGWNLSPAVGSIAQNVHTYAGNTLGLAANPNGGTQFLGGRSTPSIARAQHDVNWGASSQWVISYDLCPNYDGALPAAINLASTSDQLNTTPFLTRQFISLKNFVNPADPINGGWRNEFNVFDANGLVLAGQVTHTGLTTNHWYRESISVDFSTNQVTRVSMTDLTTNITTDFIPPGWYLTGGTNPVNPMPDAFRFFVGGSAGNIMGWDNLSIAVPAPSALALLGLGGLAAARRRR